MKNFERKSILRNTIGKNFPKEVKNNKKMGFSVPVREWLKNATYKDLIIENNSTLFNLLNYNKLEDIYNQNMVGNKDYGQFLWSIIILKKFFDKVYGKI